MDATMARQVDPLRGHPHGLERGLDRCVRRRDERKHGPMVGRVRLDVEQLHSGDPRQGTL
jgi:hypothetical protein